MATSKAQKAAEKAQTAKENNAAIKAFKSSSEVVDFYQFIHDNGLREEAQKIMAAVLTKIKPQKKRGRKKVLQ
jgi:ABC-type lipoprotein release transport system permease subunit